MELNLEESAGTDHVGVGRDGMEVGDVAEEKEFPADRTRKEGSVQTGEGPSSGGTCLAEYLGGGGARKRWQGRKSGSNRTAVELAESGAGGEMGPVGKLTRSK